MIIYQGLATVNKWSTDINAAAQGEGDNSLLRSKPWLTDACLGQHVQKGLVLELGSHSGFEISTEQCCPCKPTPYFPAMPCNSGEKQDEKNKPYSMDGPLVSLVHNGLWRFDTHRGSVCC